MSVAPLFSCSLEWERTHYISIYSLGTYAQKGLIFPPSFYFRNYLQLPFHPIIYLDTKQNDLIFIQAHHLRAFYLQVLPFLPGPVRLMVCSDWDLSVPSEVLLEEELELLLNHKNVACIFSTGCDYKGNNPKLQKLPIGIDFHSKAYLTPPFESSLNQEKELEEIFLSLPPTALRKKRIFVDFQHNDTMARAQGTRLTFYAGETRTKIFHKLCATGLVDFREYCSRKESWQTKGQYAFSVSPHGHGLDTHRTWEDLALGCIVIVKTSPLDPLYEGLPVVIVKSWDEITQENLDLWLAKYGNASTNPNYRYRLTNAYWIHKIKEFP